MQTKDNTSQYFFLLALLAVSVLTFFIFKPFFSAILAAAILAVIFQKPYNYFFRITGKRKALSSIFASVLIILIVVIPILVLLGLIAAEVNGAVKSISNISEQLGRVGVLNIIGSADISQQINLGELLDKSALVDTSKTVLLIVSKTYQGVSSSGFWLFVMFLSLFYFFIDGKKIVKKLIYLSPLSDTHERMLIEKFVSISRATLKGTIVIGIIQGAIGGITFLATGTSSPFLLAFLMILFSVIPLVGAFIVWLPAGIIMLALGNVWQGIVILTVGTFIISTIDNLLRPKLVGHDTQMYPLLVFFSTVGGIILFGISGFILGPVIMAFFLTLWEIYAATNKNQSL